MVEVVGWVLSDSFRKSKDQMEL